MHSASFSLADTPTLMSCRLDTARSAWCCRAAGRKANGILAADAVTLWVVVLLCLAASGTAHAEPCRSQSFEGASYVVCSFDLTQDDLRIDWRGSNGKPYRTFAALAADLEAKGKSLRFAMNGGMYQDDLRPVGLYIENGRELTPTNTATLHRRPQPDTELLQKAERRLLYRRQGGGRPRDRTISRPQAESEFCHAVRSDARHRRRHPSCLHREFN